MTRPAACLAAAAALLLPLPAAAQIAPEFAYGVGATTNYIWRGETQSDDRPALQGYVEGSSGIVYAGAWASTVRLDDDRAELNLYLGIRQSLGDLAVDLGYTRYLYDRSGDCCGELGLGLGYPVNDAAEVGGSYFLDPENDTHWLEATGAFAAPLAVTLSATLGTDFGSLDLDGGDKRAWNLGAARSFGGFVTLDLRYHDSNYDPGRVALSVGLDF